MSYNLSSSERDILKILRGIELASIVSMSKSNTGFGRASLDIFSAFHVLDPEIKFFDFSQTSSFFGRFVYNKRWRNLPSSGTSLMCCLPPILWIFVPREFVIAVFDVYASDEKGLRGLVLRFFWFVWLKRAKFVLPVSSAIKNKLSLNQTFPPLLNIVKFKGKFGNTCADRVLRICVITSNKVNKNQELLLEIIRRSRRLSVVFYIVGLREQTDISDNVLSVSWVSDLAMQDIFDICDGLLCCSKDEGLSYPVIDALVKGMFIITTPIPVFDDYLGGYGRWIKVESFDDPNRFVDEIEKLI